MPIRSLSFSARAPIRCFAPDDPARVPSEPGAFAECVPAGRLVEIAGGHAGSAQTTAAVACVVQAQARGEPAAWVQAQGGPLYPPDLDAYGVDLEALVVVHVPMRAGPHGAAKAAEILLRSGGFGTVVVDLRKSPPVYGRITSSLKRSPPVYGGSPGAAREGGELEPAAQSRLFALAREHGSTVLLLTVPDARLGSLVALRVEPRRTRIERARFAVEHRVLKDKTGLFPSFVVDPHRGPPGLV